MARGAPGRLAQITPPTGMFVIAALAGWAPSFACGLCLVVPTGFDRENVVSHVLVALCVSCFVGGFISGWLLEPGLRDHRWRLLWLAAGSPALPAWAFALSGIISGREFSTRAALMLCLICALALAGSYVGSAVGHRYRMWVSGGQENGREEPSLSGEEAGTGEE